MKLLAILICAALMTACGGGSMPAAVQSTTAQTVQPVVSKMAGPIITPTQPWEGTNIEDGSVVKVAGTYYRFYCAGSVPFDIGYATSTNFPMQWVKNPNNPIIFAQQFYSGSGIAACAPRVIAMPDGSFRMYVHAFNGLHDRGFLLTSVNFPDEWSAPQQIFSEGSGWDGSQIQTQSIIPSFQSPDGLWHLFYIGSDGATYRGGHATSTDGISWTRDPANPIMKPDTGWKSQHIAPLGWFKRDGTYYILAQGFDGQKWSLGYYASGDLKTFAASGPILSGTLGGWDSSGIEGVDAFSEGPDTYLFYLGSAAANPVSGGFAYRTGVATFNK